MFGRLYMIIGTVSALYRRAQIAALRALAAGPGPRQPRCRVTGMSPKNDISQTMLRRLRRSIAVE